jgi:uncharacterized protein (TIGR03086 family)
MSVDMMQRVVDQTTNIVDNVKTDQLGNATPCADWNVRDVLNHIVGGSTMFAVSAEEGAVPDEMVGQLMGGDCLGDDYKAAWAESSARAMAAFDGADMSKVVKLPFGEMPLGVALNIAIFDVTTHALDLAQATEQQFGDTELLDDALAIANQMITPELRQPGVFGPEQPCPDDATAAQRLLAFTGRTI